MKNENAQEGGDLLQLMTELERPEVQQSLTSLLNKLPEFEKSIDSIGNAVQFGKAVFEDQTAIQKYDQLLSTYNLNIETITAMVALLEKLPKLLKLIEQLEEIMEFVTAVIQDEQSVDYLMSNVKEYADPFVRKGKDGLTLFEEVQNRMECNPQNVKLFSLVKWLKDPMVQKGLCYVQATMEVLNERTQKNNG
ncbi:hypothetical protein [Sporosarcina cyprini]|uniref:hypothetical protein n=1 Tax=Sporosarcina cyprini TaxID=2910523 RepID=UPI001EDE1126|nr:hypothetical protein [Sporosarcina cyprini]MCG3086425.1 hypothetical protein [Sporosarcina cyprini]